MTDARQLPSDHEIATARDIVTRPEAYAAQPALRENAWRTLTEARGGTFAARHLPALTHAEPGRPARGVAAHLADRLTRLGRTPRKTTPDPAHPAPSLADCIEGARPAITDAVARHRQTTGAIARHNARLPDPTPPTGGSAA